MLLQKRITGFLGKLYKIFRTGEVNGMERWKEIEQV